MRSRISLLEPKERAIKAKLNMAVSGKPKKVMVSAGTKQPNVAVKKAFLFYRFWRKRSVKDA